MNNDFIELNELYSDELNNVLSYIGNYLIDEYPTMFINTNYIALAMLVNKNCNAYKIVEKLISVEKIDEIISILTDKIVSSSLSGLRPSKKIVFDKTLKDILLLSKEIMSEFKSDKITTEHVLLALLKTDNPNEALFAIYDITYNILNNEIKKEKHNEAKTNIANHISYTPKNVKENVISKIKKTNSPNKNSFIETYTINLNRLAEIGKTKKIIGRKSEISQVFNVLSRREKNNAILVGDSGVGKTEIVKYLSLLIMNKQAPSKFYNKTIIQLDMTALIAGTNFRGMFEERVKGLIGEIKRSKNYIVFIDDIHSVLNEKSNTGDVNMSSMLNNVLLDGEIQFIGCTNFKDYKNTFENSASLCRKFQKIVINPSSISESKEILQGTKEVYETFHNVTYTDEAIDACIKLANRYIPDRHLPDSALDLLDESAASKTNSVKDSDEITTIKEKLSEIRKEMNKLENEKKYEDSDKLIIEENKLVAELSRIEKNISKERIVIEDSDIYELVSNKTGIPISKIGLDEKKKLSEIDTKLKKIIIGQDNAISKVCAVIKRNRIGLSNKNKPTTILLLGKTGTGKTLMAKTLAKEIFGDEKYLVRLDMSEYADKGSITRLVGAPPSYVGYNDANSLSDTIRNKKYCVLLLDEIEKADDSVFNTFLQVFDDGRLTDGTGNLVDFKNVIILLTSNVGTKKAMDFSKSLSILDDDTNDSSKSYEIIKKELKHKFQPEFLNRLDDIVIFNSLTKENIKEIIKIEMRKFEKQLNEIECFLDETFYSTKTIDFLYDQIKDDNENGARPVLRIIQNLIINKVTDIILTDDGSLTFTSSVEENELKIYKK